MDRATFLKACKLSENHGDSPFLGGGEPTVHPLFWDFFGIALAHSEEESGFGIITNGKRTDDAKRLARLARAGICYAALSQDPWHEKIDPAVIKAFTKTSTGYPSHDSRDYREIRTNRGAVFNVGRAKETNIGNEEKCCCSEIVVDPDGRLFACGCKQIQLGTVDAPAIPDGFERGECYGIERTKKDLKTLQQQWKEDK
jgi:hypothetical protein